MIVEHVLVTTLPLAETLSRAEGYLSQRGFRATGHESAFPLAGQPEVASLEMRRGDGGGTGLRIPQRIRLDFDRGRVTFAIAVETTLGRKGFGSGGAPGELMRQRLALTIAEGLNELLSFDRSGEARYGDWDAVEADGQRVVRKTIVRMIGVMVAVLLVAAGLIVFLIVAASNL
jgi:hypothetical protein